MKDDTASPAATAPVSLNFVLLCVFIDMLGVGLIIPVLPVLVGEFVAAREQQSLWYGVLGATFGLAQFVFMPMLGAISDKVGRRPVLLYSMVGMSLNFLVTALAPTLGWLLAGRVIGGMSAASMSVASAYASDVSTPDNRAKSFGKIGAAFGMGFIAGPMLGGILGGIDLHLPFYVAAGMAAANFIYGWFFLPESLPPGRRGAFPLHKLNPLGGLIKLWRRHETRGLVAVFTLVALAQTMLHTTWVLYTTFRFGWSTTQNGIALFCVGVANVIVQAGLLGMLMKRFGEVRLSLLGLGSGAVTYLLYGLATQGWMMYVLILCNLLAFAAGPALQGIISKAAPATEQGELMGSLQAINSVGVVLMPLLGGFLLAEVSHLPPSDWRIGVTFFVSAVMQVVAILVARRWFRDHHRAL
ncbi:TCR/Tet family MFS transporter [Pseudoduganella lutea]|uniref:MFS transporter n=1 Tax=Pseudoduganella lutea TaxID=321985 RepID=A0A4P6L5H1_9BURK|nr:TCR/Tet family MFS transporter [Pseudoduganella lutea]QBE66911.1 MFS transporter [Pseudoduganella lutea]